jgi:type II secretory pathway pseudopilin PulG
MMENTQINSMASKHANGYMLIEALIAIAIFSIGFMAVATLVLTATRNNTNGNILTQANMLARQTLEQVKNTPDITTLPSGPAINTESGIDADGNPGGIYTRTTKVEDILGFNTSRSVEVSVSWRWRGTNRSIVMSTITKGKGI